MDVPTLDDLDADGTTVGVRVDINSPMTDEGTLADDARLHAHIDTLSELLDRDARVGVLAHQGRPGGDEFSRLEPHAERLDELLDHPVRYVDATFSADARKRLSDLSPGEAVVLENTRFYSEEYMEFDPERAAHTHLVACLAPALDAYVNDAFAAAHRSQPSLVGFPSLVPAYAGRVMEHELDVLGRVAETPTPRVCVFGGAKVPDSLDVARHVLENGLVEDVVTTGVVGNVFLLADGVDLGTESTEFVRERGYDEQIERAADLLAEFPDAVHLPTDVAVERDGERVELAVTDLPPEEGEAVMDIGSDTIAAYSALVEDAGTTFLNGPAGAFEEAPFETGTRELFDAVTRSSYSIVGGGDSAAAIRRFGLSGFDHVSTGGGATLRMLTGDPLPAVEVLRR